MSRGNEPAFPRPMNLVVDPVSLERVITDDGANGMTLRQYYAGLAMQGLNSTLSLEDIDIIVEFSVKYADALIVELEKEV